jgi:hypothetical protein
VVQFHRRHQLPLAFVGQFPTAHVMTARDDARSNSFRHPRAHDVVTNLSFDAQRSPVRTPSFAAWSV